MSGQLLALSVQLALQQFLTPAEMTSWGWRVPFVIGAGAALGALYLRQHMRETAAFEQENTAVPAARVAQPSAFKQLLAYPRATLTVVGLTLAFYTFMTCAVAIFGGTAEYLALFAKEQGREEWFYWYVTGCALLSLLVYWRMGESQASGHMNEA